MAAASDATAANEAAIAAASAELESTRRTSSRTKKATSYAKLDDEVAVANSPSSSETGASTSTKTAAKKANGSTPAAKSAAAAASTSASNTPTSAAAGGKVAKKRKKRDGTGDDATNYNDSDAEFEAMLEEQCRMDESEQAKKKQRQAARKIAAETKNPTSTIISTNLTSRLPNGGGAGRPGRPPVKAKMKNSAEPDEFEVVFLY